MPVVGFLCGDGGIRTHVQTSNRQAFYILSVFLIFDKTQVNTPTKILLSFFNFVVLQSHTQLSLCLRCSGQVATAKSYKAEHCGLILGIKRQERNQIRQLIFLKVRINVSFLQHTVCLQVNCTCCRNHVVPGAECYFIKELL
jgi:hypothetical protein